MGAVFFSFLSPEVPQAMTFGSVQKELFSFFLRSFSLDETPKIDKQKLSANSFHGSFLYVYYFMFCLISKQVRSQNSSTAINPDNLTSPSLFLTGNYISRQVCYICYHRGPKYKSTLPRTPNVPRASR